MRGLWTESIYRKFEVPTVLFPTPPAEPASPAMPPHSVWLNTLNASARNSNPMLSLMGKRLYNAISKFVLRGFRRTLRPEFPKVRPIGVANAAGLYHRGPKPRPGVRVKPVFGSPTRSAREPEPTPAATPALSVGFRMLNGVPDEMLIIPEYSQPPSREFRSPLPRKNGRSQT